MSTPTNTETSFDILRRVALEGYFVTKEDVSRLVADHPKKQVLIRTGAGRFITSLDNCQTYVDIITNEGSDYVRDVSLYQGNTVSTLKPVTRKRTTPKSRNWPYSPTELTPQYGC